MKYKDIQFNHEWVKLARKVDDLKYVLLTYGHQFTPATLKTIQLEYSATVTECSSLEEKLAVEGWIETS